eukprot:scaffold49683_cov37-Prasinocladus_malaysianus.AAC.2
MLSLNVTCASRGAQTRKGTSTTTLPSDEVLAKPGVLRLQLYVLMPGLAEIVTVLSAPQVSFRLLYAMTEVTEVDRLRLWPVLPKALDHFCATEIHAPAGVVESHLCKDCARNAVASTRLHAVHVCPDDRYWTGQPVGVSVHAEIESQKGNLGALHTNGIVAHDAHHSQLVDRGIRALHWIYLGAGPEHIRNLDSTAGIGSSIVY